MGKGEAYVTFSSPEEAAEAIKKLHKTAIKGNSRYIEVLSASEAELAMKLERKYGGRGVAFDWDHSPEHHYGENGILLND